MIIWVRKTYVKEFFNVFFGRGRLHHGLRGLAEHVVDGVDDVEHLGLGDESVAVQVVKAENPLQLFLRRPP